MARNPEIKGKLVSDYILVQKIIVKTKLEKKGLIDPNKTMINDGDKLKTIDFDDFDEHPIQGKVLMTGPGWRTSDGHLQPMVCKTGDLVYFKYRPQIEMLKFNNRNYLLLRTSDIIYVEPK